MNMSAVLQFISEFVYLYPMLMSIVWMIGGLIFFWRLERKSPVEPELNEYPFFSIVVPGHNEEAQIEETITYLLEIDYPNYEIVFVDDGSTDNTAFILHNLCSKHEQVRGLYLTENMGKGAALNAGTMAAKGDLLLTIDADALVDPKILKWMAWHFSKYPRVGAITGNPRVINRTTLLGKIQAGEFSTIIGLIKRAQRILGKVLTVSGVVAAFRRQAVVSAGLWDTDMMTEDIDITWKLEKNFWDVRYEPRAICWIFVPETIRGLLRQRMRWAQGGIEVLKKHRDIWESWKQRRLWPIYVEYILSTVWAYMFWTLIVLWGIQAIFKIFMPITLKPPIPPLWAGSILALICVIQFGVSFYMDRKYDKKMLRYLFWVIWYPFAYWAINSVVLIFAVPKALLKPEGTRAVWLSPDRGIDRLKT